jgi:hypothetical protein
MYVEEIARLKQYLNQQMEENESLKKSQEVSDSRIYEDALANKPVEE